jgi:hypothetical protein
LFAASLRSGAVAAAVAAKIAADVNLAAIEIAVARRRVEQAGTLRAVVAIRRLSAATDVVHASVAGEIAAA